MAVRRRSTTCHTSQCTCTFFFLFIFIWRVGKKKLALKVKKSPAVIIFLLALEHLWKEKLVVCEQANGADTDTPHWSEGSWLTPRSLWTDSGIYITHVTLHRFGSKTDGPSTESKNKWQNLKILAAALSLPLNWKKHWITLLQRVRQQWEFHCRSHRV